MTVYVIDISSTVNAVNSFEAALVAEGLLTTKHFEDTQEIIVTTPRSAKVLSYRWEGGQMGFCRYGDAYVSGNTITNPVIYQPNIGGAATSGVLVVTDDVLAYLSRGNNGACAAVIGNLDTLAAENFALGTASNRTDSWFKDLTNDVQIEMPALIRQVLSAGGHYYMYDPIVCSASDVLVCQGIAGMKMVAMPRDNTVAHTVYGDQVVFPLWGANGLHTYFWQNMMIVDGNL